MKQTITALALIKLLWDSYNRDYLDAMLPLLAILVQRRGLSQINDTRELQKCFDQEWGLQIPYHALSAILNRARKRRLLTRSSNVFYPTLGVLREYAEVEKATERHAKVRQLLEGLCSFAETKLKVAISIEEAENLLISYLKRHSADLSLLSGWESALPGSATDNRALSVFAAYAQHLRDTSAPEFKTLQEVWFGHALVDAIALPSPKSLKSKLRGLTIYLDAPVVFALIGVSGEEKGDAARELLGTAREQGALLRVFHHTYDEVYGILDSSIPWLRNLSAYNPALASTSLRYFVDNGRRPSDVEELLADLPAKVQALKIEMVPMPSAVENASYQIDELQFEQIIRSIYHSTPTDFTIQRDIQSIAGVYRLRRDRLPRSVSEARHLFLTTNYSLAVASRRYEQQYVSDSYFIPAALTDVFLGTILWLENPGSFESINRLQLLSDIRSLLEPSEALVRRFVKIVDELGTRGDLDPAQVVALKTSRVARGLLQDITLGEPGACTYETAQEILERMENAVRLEERARAEERVQRIETERQRERNEKLAVTQDAAAAKARIVSVADGIGTVVAVVFFVGGAVVVVSLLLFLAIDTESSGWVKGFFVAAAVLVGSLGLIVPVRDLWSLCSRLRSRVSLVVRKFLWTKDL